MNTEKIFIDLDDDLTFVVEKVRNSDASNIALIVPKNATLTGSYLSLKVLAKNLAKSSKNIVIVTEDELGIKLSEKSQLVAVENAKEINDKLWQEATEKKEEIVSNIERNKRILLERRHVEKETDYKIVEEPLPTKVDKIDEIREEISAVEDEPEEEIKSIRPSVRVPAKVTVMSGIKFYSAGDILENNELLEELIPRKFDISENDKDEDGVNEPPEGSDGDDNGVSNSDDNQEIIEVKEEPKSESNRVSSKKEIIGKDYSTVGGGTFSRRRIPTSNIKPSKIADSGSNIIESVKKTFNTILDTPQKKKIAAVVLVLVTLVLGSTQVLGSSVDVVVTVKEDSLDISQKINANTQVQGINTAKYEIPAEPRTQEETSSESGSATGVGVTGEKAQGSISIFNLSDKAVSIKAGTKVTIVSSSLVYTINSNVNVPSSSVSEDVGITATEGGEKYNESDEEFFKIDGFNFDEVKGKNLRAIQGGVSEEITVVSKEDIESLKNIVSKRLESTALSKFKASITEKEYLFEESIKVEVTDEQISHKVGQEADRFDVTLTGKVTAIVVLKSDVEEMIKSIVQEKQEIEGESDIVIEQFPDFENVTVQDGVVSFSISTSASAKANITEEFIQESIEGKSIDDSENFFKDQTDIINYEINYNPSFLPNFLKRIPDKNNIKVTVRSA